MSLTKIVDMILYKYYYGHTRDYGYVYPSMKCIPSHMNKTQMSLNASISL